MTMLKTLRPAMSTRAAALMAAAVSAIALSAPAAAEVSAPANCGGPASDTWLNVTVQGVRSSDGLVAVTLYPNNQRRFLVKKGSLYTARVNAQAGTTQACIFVPQPGTYAIAVYHDENANRRLDRSGLGMPREGFGFTNNPSTLGGIPAFRSVLFTVPRANVSTQINLRYP